MSTKSQSEESTPEQLTAEQIRSQMHQYRREVHSDVGKFVQDAQSLGDWQIYVRAKPLIAFAVCAAVGFVLVPKRKEYLQPNAEQIARMVSKKKLVVAPPKHVKNDGMFSGLSGVASKFAIQALSGIVMQKLGESNSSKTEKE